VAPTMNPRCAFRAARIMQATQEAGKIMVEWWWAEKKCKK